jgi:hypothetical protein
MANPNRCSGLPTGTPAPIIAAAGLCSLLSCEQCRGSLEIGLHAIPIRLPADSLYSAPSCHFGPSPRRSHITYSRGSTHSGGGHRAVDDDGTRLAELPSVPRRSDHHLPAGYRGSKKYDNIGPAFTSRFHEKQTIVFSATLVRLGSLSDPEATSESQRTRQRADQGRLRRTEGFATPCGREDRLDQYD